MKFAHPEDLKKSNQELEKHFRRELDYYEFASRMKHKNGQWVWVLDRGKVIEWDDEGKPVRMAGTHQDITEQKLSEKTLHDNKVIMDLFFSQSLTGFFFMMMDEPLDWKNAKDKEKALEYALSHHRITRINPAMLSQYGATEKDFIGLTPGDLFSHDIEQGKKLWKKLFDTGRLHSESKERKLDGTPIIILGDYTCLYDEDGKIVGHFGVQTDVTEIRGYQEELEESKRKAWEASHAKSMFLANMSHEIRTPLNGVIGFTDLLCSTNLSPIQKQYAENANTSGHALLGIINDILDFSKIEAGMWNLEETDVDLLEIMEQSIDLVKFQANAKHLEILLNPDPTIPQHVKSDPVRLKQVLSNLLSNAVKFTFQGEVELKLEYKPISSTRGEFSFFVKDTGIGIGEEEKRKIFQTFGQADDSTTRKFGGTGLGLVISDMIIQKMGGKIHLQSEKGKGSIFSFRLEFEIINTNYSIPREHTNIKNCLLVDDNASNRLILSSMLKLWNIESREASSVTDALKILEKEGKFDIIISDYYMPERNGLDLIRLIRKEWKWDSHKQPILLLHSSSDDVGLYNSFVDLDVNLLLTKPVKWKEFHRSLQNFPLGKDLNRNSPKSILESASIPSFNDKRILVAEDKDMNYILVESLLKKIASGLSIERAKDGKIAWDKIQSEQYDLVLMDVQMPEMDGITVTKLVREKEDKKHLPILALTAGALKEEKELCIKAGMDGFLTKPIDINKIKEALLRYLIH